MPLVVLLGGARAGKSRLALELARETGAPVTVLVTAEGRDDEMRERIAAHRAERPSEWSTVEEPIRVGKALEAVPADHTVVLDCLSLWVANLLERETAPSDVLAAAEQAAALAAGRSALTVAVSNEVGLGIVPATPLGRVFRDLLGSVNRVWVEASSQAALVVAGRALTLHGPRDVLLAPRVDSS
jgi:adenosylcobinamide kinase / adenosylcobinamide-phosphate guanylyltransferase